MKRTHALLIVGGLTLQLAFPPGAAAQLLTSQRAAPSQQTPAQPPPTTNQVPQEQEFVFRVSTQLVQIDSIVTDKKGNHVEDLTENDFELRVDGKLQPISYLKLVKLTDSNLRPTSEIAATPKPSIPTPTTLPTRRLEQKQVRRTIALVVDDLGLGFSSVAYAKDALKKFVAEQMQEGDLVAIVRTSGGFGIYQQFTSDKRILYAAIDRLKFALNGRKAIPFTLSSTSSLMGRNDVFKTDAEKYQEERAARGGRKSDPSSDPNEAINRDSAYHDQKKEAADEDVNTFRENIFSNGTLGALNQVVRALRALPGRKIAIILSDGLPLKPGPYAAQAQRKILQLVELANRSSVAFYSVNVQGVQAPIADAAIESIDDPQRDKSFSGGSTFDDGLRTLAYGTGGLAFFNNNKTDALLAKSVADNKSYYLIGFDPDDDKFDRLQHKITLRVKRPELQARTRNGFFGIEDSLAREIPKTKEAQILNALFSPFGANEIPYQVTSLFYSTTTGEPVIRSYFHIDCSTLKFKDEDNGEKSLMLELANFTFDESGAVVERYAQSFEIRLNDAKYQQVLREGLTYLNDFPVKKPGAYHFRSALRDGLSGQIGSSSQFILIPDLKKDRLALSGIILNVVEKSPTQSTSAPANGNDVLTTQLQANPAARRFASDSELEYQAAIYNPKLDRQTNKPRLKLQFELYRDNQLLFRSPERAVNTERQKDSKWLDCGGRFQLNRLTTGEYWLRLVIRDELREGKSAVAEQWIDFSVR